MQHRNTNDVEGLEQTALVPELGMCRIFDELIEVDALHSDGFSEGCKRKVPEIDQRHILVLLSDHLQRPGPKRIQLKGTVSKCAAIAVHRHVGRCDASQLGMTADGASISGEAVVRFSPHSYSTI